MWVKYCIFYKVLNLKIYLTELLNVAKLCFYFFIFKLGRNGHFGYPVLGKAAMDQLFEGLSDSDTTD